MTRFPRLLTGAAVAVMLCAGSAAAQAQSFSPAQRQEVEQIVREYLLKHPEVLQEVVQELEKRQAAAEADRSKAALAQHRERVFNSPHQVVLGNPKGDVTLVEFFDYNCGYCKRALADKLEIVKTDPKLRLVLKEFPVLGPGSIEAAQVAVAVRMQAPQKYLEFHQKLLGSRGQADKARALAAARDVGLDVARIEKDLQSPEVKATLEEVMQMSEALGINGTPTYIVGNAVVPGAVGVATLRQQIAAARKASQSQ
ncbi:MAG: thioredoxin domain-containing protein [Variibacter sp.]|nr:thioredoxin domain-containing protein [Variibacter sp.]